jgi:ribosomal protein S18 acetylase RimI-like enzyme
LKIRHSKLSDARAVGALYVELQQHHFALQPDNPRYRLTAERWREIARIALEHPDDEVLIAEEEDGAVVGCAVLRYEGKPWGLACQIETLIVTGRRRGRGIGRQLVAAGEEAAARRGALAMRVEVVVENDEGQRFYDDLGYQGLALRLGKPL